MGLPEQPSTEMLAMTDGWYHEGKMIYQHFVGTIREQIKEMTEDTDEKEQDTARKMMMVAFAETVDTMIEAASGQGQFQSPTGEMAPPEVVAMIQSGIRKQLAQLTAFAMFNAAMNPVEDEADQEIDQLNELFAWDGTDDES